MNIRLKNCHYTFFLLFITFSCSQGSKNTNESATSENEKSTITLNKAPSSPDYSDSKLSSTNIDMTVTDSSYIVDFGFEVENYELGTQTEDAATRGIANSGKGQHIHLILNNGPYSAHYESVFSRNLEVGNYVTLAFLSRSYHESVKNPNAYFLFPLKVGEPAETLEFDLEGQHLFYSRPKGIYSGADTEKLMLDFYLINTTLANDGNKVRATINGEEFMIDEWAPYYIEGLPKGEITIKLELLDAAGNFIPGPFNVIERTVTLTD